MGDELELSRIFRRKTLNEREEEPGVGLVCPVSRLDHPIRTKSNGVVRVRGRLELNYPL